MFENVWHLNLFDMEWFGFGFACFATIACSEFYSFDFMTFSSENFEGLVFLRHIPAFAGNIGSSITNIDSKNNGTIIGSHTKVWK